MGKDSKHQRTKGGVQPSSSARSAELLQKGSATLSFMSLSAEARAQTTVLSNLLIDEDLPTELRLVFKKITKKDSVTKIKALNELNTMLRDLDESDCKLLLPHWIKAYQKLVLDDDRKVREQAQVTLGVVGKIVGRNLGPHLKQLMPSWLLAQYDIYFPVASVASSTFSALFPNQSKRIEVLKFSRGEILQAILDNLRGAFAGGSKDKEVKGKKNGQELEQQKDEGEGVGALTSEESAKASDDESFQLRITCASFQSLRHLLNLSLVDDEILSQIFGKGGLFWSQPAITKESLVQRVMYETLASLAAAAASPALNNFTIPSPQCAAFIKNALNSNQRENLANGWQAFITLTVSGVLSDNQLVKKQLLNCARHGFYGNASQIGGSVLPLLSHLEDHSSSFYSELMEALISGYARERSLFERAVIARTLASVVAFISSSQEDVDLKPLFTFIFRNLSDLHSDFGRAIGAKITSPEFYRKLLDYAFSTEETAAVNTREFGSFTVALCSPPPAEAEQSHGTPGGFRRQVKFNDEGGDEGEEGSSPPTAPPFPALTAEKQLFLQSLVSLLVLHGCHKPLAVLCKKFPGSPALWSSTDPLSLNIPPEEEDKRTALDIYLELLRTRPEAPTLLAKFSEQFERFKGGELGGFLLQVEPYTHLQPIRRWLKMPDFTSALEDRVVDAGLGEGELGLILRFLFRDDELFPEEFCSRFVSLVLKRAEEEPHFFDSLSHTLLQGRGRWKAGGGASVQLKKIYKFYWEALFRGRLSPKPCELELVERVCFQPSHLEAVDPAEIISILETHLDACDKLGQINNLVEIHRRLGYPPEVVAPLPPFPLKIRGEVLQFMGLCYGAEEWGGAGTAAGTVIKLSRNHQGILARGVFLGKLVLSLTEEEESSSRSTSSLIPTLLQLLYAQAFSKVWEEGEKCGYFETPLNRELSSELDVLSSRLAEKIHEDRAAWKELWGRLQDSWKEGDADDLWKSGLPYRILSYYCDKAELNPITTTSPGAAAAAAAFPESFPLQVSHILGQFTQAHFTPSSIIPWLTEKRVKSPELFQFETLYRHQSRPNLLPSLLLITVEMMERAVKGDEISEEFLSLATCWIAAWAKSSKHIEAKDRAQLRWVAGLARGISVVGAKARSSEGFRIVQEFVEFHAASLYPVVLSWYRELGGLPHAAHNFWTLSALYQVSSALVSCPSPTLAYIEPRAEVLCDLFGGSIAAGVSLPARICSYRMLKKVRYESKGDGEDATSSLPIVPTTISKMILELLEKIRGTGSCRSSLESYLMLWDALLKLQRGSVEFASYVKESNYLLNELLRTLFFHETIALDKASPKHFETETQLKPGDKVDLLALACCVLQRVLRGLPYTVRWWWNNQLSRQRDKIFVEKFIVKHLSAKLAAEELGSVKLREGLDDNVTVHCHSHCNELIAHYKIEETKVTLKVSLPLNHPLGPVTVKISDKKLHGKINQLLNSRSHSLSAGLKLWKDGLDGLYKDVSECAICFFIIHSVNKQIPKMLCKTCKNKFHAACLYKWFSTSNKSECPLCRNLF